MNISFLYEISCLICNYRLGITSKEFNREQRKRTKHKPRLEQAKAEHGKMRYTNGMANGYCHENNLAYRESMKVYPVKFL